MSEKVKERCYEIHSVINDILYEAERGKITWDQALDQMHNELQNSDDTIFSALDKVVFKTQWSWHDVMAVLLQQGRHDLVRGFEKLPTKEMQVEFVEEFNDELGSVFEHGIMNEWAVVMDTAIDYVGVVLELEDLINDIEEYNYRVGREGE